MDGDAFSHSKNIVQLPTDVLIPYVSNARTHSGEQVAQIAASIKEFGFTNPVLVDGSNGIIAGHGRVLAARKLGMAEVPTIALDHLTDAQRRAYILADNKLAMNAGWDDDLLRMELGALDGDDFDLSLIGFSDMELAVLLADLNEGLTDPDETPEPPAEPVSKTGDLWTCGKHRVLCGDSTVASDVERLLDGVTPLLMVTDPPYGVDFDPTWRKGSEKRTYMGDTPDKEGVWSDVWALFPGDVVYVWHADRHTIALWQALMGAGFEMRSQIIWNKMRFIIGRSHYCINHEQCFYGVRKKGKSMWQGANNMPTVWDIRHLSSDTNHGAQKPVECMRRPIVNNSAPGQPVYDPFLGSGTTMIAAEMEGRQCLGLEIAPAYCDVIVQRWQNFTGEQATLDGKTFDEVSDAS